MFLQRSAASLSKCKRARPMGRLGASTLLLLMSLADPAFGWYAQSGSFSGSRSVTGAYGHTYSSTASGSYGGGSASINRSVTGAYGHTYNYSGNATYGGGSASVNRYASGPYGSASSSGTYNRW